MVKKVELKVVFNIYNNEMEVVDVPNLIVESVDRAGYAIESAEVVGEDLVSEVYEDDQLYTECAESLYCYREDYVSSLLAYLEEHENLEEICKKICAACDVIWDLRIGKDEPNGMTVEEAMVRAEHWWYMGSCLQEAMDDDMLEGLGLSRSEVAGGIYDVSFYLIEMSKAELYRTRLNFKLGKMVFVGSSK